MEIRDSNGLIVRTLIIGGIELVVGVSGGGGFIALQGGQLGSSGVGTLSSVDDGTCAIITSPS